MLDQRRDAAVLPAQTDAAEARSTEAHGPECRDGFEKAPGTQHPLSNECRLKLVSCDMQCRSWPPRSSPRIPSQEEPGQATARCADER